MQKDLSKSIVGEWKVVIGIMPVRYIDKLILGRQNGLSFLVSKKKTFKTLISTVVTKVFPINQDFEENW